MHFIFFPLDILGIVLPDIRIRYKTEMDGIKVTSAINLESN